MNKIDLVPATVVAAWKHYFKAQFPLIKIVCFTSLPSYNLRDGGQSSLKGQRRKGKMKMAAEGALSLLQVCEEICAKQGTHTKHKQNTNSHSLFRFKVYYIFSIILVTYNKRTATGQESCEEKIQEILFNHPAVRQTCSAVDKPPHLHYHPHPPLGYHRPVLRLHLHLRHRRSGRPAAEPVRRGPECG